MELWNHNIVKDDHIGSFEAPLLEQLLYLNQRAWYHLDTGGMIELTFSHVPAGAPATRAAAPTPTRTAMLGKRFPCLFFLLTGDIRTQLASAQHCVHRSHDVDTTADSTHTYRSLGATLRTIHPASRVGSCA